MTKDIVLVVANVRSAHNVGSMLRTADGLGIKRVYLCGYTPYPLAKKDTRLPHISKAADSKIHKTALGAEESVAWIHEDDVKEAISKLKTQKYIIACLEQTPRSLPLPAFRLKNSKIALVVGSEIGGIDDTILKTADICLEIPMSGQKESFNVSLAAAIALYHLKHLA